VLGSEDRGIGRGLLVQGHFEGLWRVRWLLGFAICGSLLLAGCVRLGYDEVAGEADQTPDVPSGDASMDAGGDAGDNPDGGKTERPPNDGGVPSMDAMVMRNPEGGLDAGDAGADAGGDAGDAGGDAGDAGGDAGDAGGDAGPIWQADGTYRKPITISRASGSAALPNFPVLVRLVLDPVSEAPHVALDDGSDIFFTADEMSTDPIPYEIDAFDRVTGKLFAWVLLQSLPSDQETTIYMYYGNAAYTGTPPATDVWVSSYVAVHHMNSLSDSTAYQYDLFEYSDPLLPVDQGAIGNSAVFGAGATRDDGYTLPRESEDVPELDGLSTMTMSAWIRMDRADPIEGILGKNVAQYPSAGTSLNTTEDPWEIGCWVGMINLDDFARNGQGVHTTGQVLLGPPTLRYLVAVFDGRLAAARRILIYLDGVEQNTVPYFAGVYPRTTTPDTRAPARIGTSPMNRDLDDTSSFYGLLDEVRYAAAARSAGWVLTEYNNQRDPAECDPDCPFVVAGAEEYIFDEDPP
jgi:hypothetical protein